MTPPASKATDKSASAAPTELDDSRTADGQVEGVPTELAEHLDRPLSAGDTVGEYEIGEQLGEGGFGTVYRAEHPLIGKSAAVKVLSREFSSNPQMVSRFIAEARAANTIRHSNIIDIFNFGTLEDGRHYFVMELLDGLSLEQFLTEQGALEPPLLLQIMAGVAQALDAAHQKGIVHRDLKPDNIFLSFDADGRPVPKLLDFGIAKLLGDAEAIAGHRTRTGTPIGTPHYMSPEQCLGEAVDERADVYGFGVVCYEALTGTKPFIGDSFLRLMNLQATGERPFPSQDNPQLGTAFDAPLRRILAIDKDERPTSLGEALELLQAAAVEGGFDVDRLRVVEADRRGAAGDGGPRAADRPPVSAATADGIDAGTGAPAVLGHARPSRTGIWLAVGALVAGVAVYLLTGQTRTTAPVTEPDGAPTAAGDPEPTTAGAQPPTSTTVTVAAQPTQLTIRIETKAKGAMAFIGDLELGKCPGTHVIDDPGQEPITLVVKAAGYHDQAVTVTPKDGETITIEPKPKRGSGAPIDDDLENPTW